MAKFNCVKGKAVSVTLFPPSYCQQDTLGLVGLTLFVEGADRDVQELHVPVIAEALRLFMQLPLSGAMRHICLPPILKECVYQVCPTRLGLDEIGI